MPRHVSDLRLAGPPEQKRSVDTGEHDMEPLESQGVSSNRPHRLGRRPARLDDFILSSDDDITWECDD